MKTIRASDINSFTYCQRSWWYRINGHKSLNTFEISAGSYRHKQHGRSVNLVKTIQMFAFAVIMFALILLILYFV